MMKKLLCLIIILAGVGLTFDASAQRILTAQEKELYKQRIEDVVNDFNGRVSEIWRRPTRVESQNMERFLAAKEIEISEALKLFIGKGKPYEEEIVEEKWNGYEYETTTRRVKHRAVAMQTSNVNNKVISNQTVESYLRKAAKAQGSRIEVSACDAYFLGGDKGELKEVAPGKYETTVAFIQDFMRYNAEGKRVYADRTTKIIRVYITLVQRPDGEYFKVELGDIRVVETVRL